MTVNRERKMIEVEYTSIDFEYNTLDEAIERLQKYREELGGDARFDTRHYSYNDDTYLAIMTKRPETDAEMAKRIAQEEHYAAQQEERDRQDYERLQKKFGKG